MLRDFKFSVIVVDGFSKDHTVEVANGNVASVIYQDKKGYGNALKTGFQYAIETSDAKIIVMMDADMTYDPRDIPWLLEPILTGGADLVVGNRFLKMQKGTMPLLNKI